MQIEWQGETLKFDRELIDVQQAYVIKTFTASHGHGPNGLGLLAFHEGTRELDPACIQLLYWIIQAQNGKQIDVDSVNLPIEKFADAVGMARVREMEANGWKFINGEWVGPDPTQGADVTTPEPTTTSGD